jgi:hypothetical protein
MFYLCEHEVLRDEMAGKGVERHAQDKRQREVAARGRAADVVVDDLRSDDHEEVHDLVLGVGLGADHSGAVMVMGSCDE